MGNNRSITHTAAAVAGTGIEKESPYSHESMRCEQQIMTTKFKVGDHVRWNSEAGHVTGRITKVHTKDSMYKGYTRHASKDDPQYEIKSDKTDHIAMHKGSALKKVK